MGIGIERHFSQTVKQLGTLTGIQGGFTGHQNELSSPYMFFNTNQISLFNILQIGHRSFGSLFLALVEHCCH